MRTFSFALASVAFVSGAHAAPPAAIDVDCALYRECADPAAKPAPEVAAPDATANSRVRHSATRGFSMSGPAPSSSKPAATAASKPVRVALVTNPKKAVVMQRVQAVKAAQGITFFNGSDQLTPEGTDMAQRIAASMLRPDKLSMRFSLQGHTDAVGARDYNLNLSQRRAKALAAYLTAQGINPSRFDTVGYGFDRPLPGVDARNAANRRVEVKPL